MTRFALWYRLRQIKSERGCVDCGERDPDYLDFDHDGEDKVANLSDMTGGSVERLEDELRKVVVRCVKCHRQVTAMRRALDAHEIAEMDSYRDTVSR